MRLFYSTTSPYARLVRIALAEKGISFDAQLTDPWKDDPLLLAANASARVPTLVLDNGQALAESLLIVSWLENEYPANPLIGKKAASSLALAGVAMGGIDAAAAIIIGRKMTDASFDESPVGLRRRRSVVEVLRRLDAAPPTIDDEGPGIAAIAAVVLLDYIRFRFPTAAWLPPVPNLDALSGRLRLRPSFSETLPREMPAA
jgi:glutathione S-transferase